MSDENKSRNNAKILIVEDSPTQAEQLKYLLEMRGYRPAVTNNGRQALAAMRQTRPDLVISDIVMPEMDGYQLCKAIKQDPYFKETPVVLMTSLSSPQDVIRGLECGADSFVRKPYNEKFLLTRLDYLLINQELRQQQQSQMGLEVALDGRKHFITAERQQILDLLISTYDEAIHLNEGLQSSYQSLNVLYRIAEGLNQATSEHEVCETTLFHAMELPGVRAGWILLREGESDFRVAATHGMPPALRHPNAMTGNCLCRRKLLSGELQYTTNIMECERLTHASNDTWGLRHHASIPLWVGDRVLGLVNLVGADEGLFDAEALKMLYGVGNQVGIALERARLRQDLERIVAERTAALTAEVAERKQAQHEVQKQLHRLMGLRAIDHTITAGHDLETTLHTILEQVIDQLEVDAADVLLFNRERQVLEYAAGRGFRTQPTQPPYVRMGEGIAGRVALDRQMSHVPDLTAKPEFTRSAHTQGFVEYYGAPLIAKGKVVGVLEIFNRSTLAADREWLNYFETLAGQTAIAVDNAYLVAETHRLLQQTQQIIDTIPEGVVVLDREQRVVLANPTARTYLPVLATQTADNVLTRLGDRPLGDFLRPLSPDQIWREVEVTQPPRIFEVAAQPMLDGPQTGDWLLVILDMTAERERRRYQEAQERLATVGQLAAGIGHDFNNIMGVIVLYARMLRNASGLSDRHRIQLATICDQADNAARLIRQILDFGRRSAMERAPLDLLPQIKELVKLLERILPENVRISLAYDQNTYAVYGDPTQLEQVLMNLALNSRDAMPGGGTLLFDLSTLTVAEGEAPPLPDMASGNWLRLVVSDTGTGVPPEHLPHLFEPFFTTKPPGKGTGLGLAQVHGIVKQHDGHIDIESQLGEGMTVTVYLPLLTAATTPRQFDTTTEFPQGNGELVLVVEDNEPLREALMDHLESWNYRTLAATDGEDALAQLANAGQDVALVLSDLVMPGMGGTALLQALRQRGDETPMILLTGYPLEKEEKDALRTLRLYTWLLKPPDLNRLAHALREALTSRHAGNGS